MDDKLLLIADDDGVYRNLTKRILKIIGYENVLEACSGEEALDVSMKYSPDLILLDVEMPGMDGISALRIIKEQRPDARVVIMTGSGTPTRVMDSMKAGASNFLLKPFGVEHIRTVLRKAMNT